jgi:hypothetical protein
MAALLQRNLVDGGFSHLLFLQSSLSFFFLFSIQFIRFFFLYNFYQLFHPDTKVGAILVDFLHNLLYLLILDLLVILNLLKLGMPGIQLIIPPNKEIFNFGTKLFDLLALSIGVESLLNVNDPVVKGGIAVLIGLEVLGLSKFNLTHVFLDEFTGPDYGRIVLEEIHVELICLLWTI